MSVASLALGLVSAVPVAAAATTDFAGRVASLEGVAQKYFRGTPLRVDEAALSARADRYNATAARRQSELKTSADALEKEFAPVRELEALIEKSATKLAVRPSGNDASAAKRYNDDVAAHNRLVARHDALAEALRPRIAAHEQAVKQVHADFDGEAAALEKARQALATRRSGWEAFSANDGDIRYQGEVNRLLADLRDAERAGRGRPELLTRVRALRRELAAWAATAAAAEPNGLILVEAMTGDEPCQYIFDTGAQSVTLPEEIVRALAWQGRMGDAETIHGVGGGKVQGKPLKLPSLTVLSCSASAVGANAMARSEGVGIDGLLGQSFLKGFRITITPGAVPRVRLEPMR